MATDNKLFFSNLKKLFSTGTIVRQIGKKQLVVKDLDSRQANLSRRLYDRYNRLFHSQYTTKSYLSGWRPGQTVDRRMRYFDYECIAGNTIISTPAGNFTIEELSKIYPDKYTKFIVYSYDTKNQKIVFGTAHSARKTKTDMTYKVKLSKNKEIIATADHPILMKNEEYKTIGELKVNDEVMSFDKNVYQYKVVSVKPHKVIDVYDISVNEYHNFATDSIFVHNCMDADPLCSSVLDVYAEEAGLEDESGELLNITSDNENITEILHNLFYDIINLEFNFFPWVRNLCKYGDMFLALEISPEYGVINVYPFSVYEIEREEGVDEKNPNAVRFILMGNRQESLENYEVIHFRLLSDTILLPYGRSILEPGRRIWKQLQLMEDAMLIYRIMRAPERRIFYINVGNLAANDIDNFMQKAISKVKKTPVIDSSTGEFNLRYNVMPVKWDTKIPLLDGRSITIKQLSEEYNSGKENWVYSIDRENNNKIVPGKVTWCGLTRPDAKLIRVTLDDDGYVDMTPDHPVMLRDGNYIEAQQLKVNDSIMPFYTKLSIEPGIKNYEKIYDPSNNEYEFTHRIVSRELNIDNYNNTKNIVHHQNFVRLDNSPGNLNCSMNAADHIRYHVNNAKGRKKPEHSKWMKENYIPYIRTPEQCENISKRMTGKNNPNYGKSVSAYTRSKLSASIKKTKRSETFKKKYNEIFTAEYRKLIGEKSTINNKERWANEKFRNHICFAMKDKFDDYLFNKMIQYITINPDTNLDNLTTLMNSNPELYGHYIEINMNRMKPKQFQKHVLQRSIRKRLGLTYREFKKEIQNNQILNHKVKSIENIENSDAYCMTVDKYHNFATDTYNSNTRSGIFVKNSIAEDFFFPVRGGEDNPTKVETLPGGQNTGDIEDVTYLLSKLFSAFKVPKSFLQYESDVSAKSTLAIEDIRFSRSVERVQKIIEAELTKIAIIHLYSQGFRNEDLINFDLKLTRSSTLREQQKLDLLDKKVSMTKSCRESESLSMKWIYETVWEFSEDEIKDIEDEIINDKKTMFRMAQIQDGGNDPAITNKVVDTSNTASDNNSASSGSKEDTSTKSADKEVGFDWNDEKDSNKEERNSNVGFDNKRVTGYAPTISAAYLSNIAKKFNITDKNIRTSNGMNLLSEGYGEKLIDKIDGILENSKLL